MAYFISIFILVPNLYTYNYIKLIYIPFVTSNICFSKCHFFKTFSEYCFQRYYTSSVQVPYSSTK